ncbi:hypothetical protein CDAR_471051 [Caerostris darwini]|uniref:Uncharacterized protein n=1 Tax=Caerostris darwini TaxID=1538125 RepID=A0AAV4QLZ7_9ARAC|nr:hypothetical protein CDAR_471051 [Caerostris darwini]
MECAMDDKLCYDADGCLIKFSLVATRGPRFSNSDRDPVNPFGKGWAHSDEMAQKLRRDGAEVSDMECVAKLGR